MHQATAGEASILRRPPGAFRCILHSSLSWCRDALMKGRRPRIPSKNVRSTDKDTGGSLHPRRSAAMRERYALTFAFMVVGALTLGCGSSPVSPTAATRSSVATGVPVPPTALATLSIENAFAIGGPEWICSGSGCEPGSHYLYQVRLLVRESSGRSGATVKAITVYNPNHAAGETYSQVTSESCWRDTLRAPAGGTLDVFYTDSGANWLSYCYAGIGAAPGVSRLSVEVTFTDDDGHPGTATTTITAFE